MERAKTKQYDSLTDYLRAQATVITHPIARLLEKLGMHPNTVTIIGLLLNIGAGAILAAGHLVWGGIFLLIASSVDSLDGALARVSGAKSRFGAFLDSTLDRISEGALFFGLLIWLVNRGLTLEIYLVYLIILGSVMVSYTRARAEGVGYDCKVGILTRLERVVVLGAGLIIGWVRPTLIVMAVFTWVTVFQRVFYVYRESRKNP
ncbi:MAG TPA: CDP-alcohol phosphatidyltransferase family protein [Anaerolineae bacterium]|nr:CDP-alcohol phosphatidyltransferase family protein [Anaerolineae bacterium]HQI85052.1 CDP-alcohol phosphatidyltransferase family protein [Anaerolineae bacterium]